MASVILTAAAQAAVPGLGGSLLGLAANAAGSWIDRQWQGVRNRSGARLENLAVQDARYGAGIPKVYGLARVAGQIIWLGPLQARDEAVGSGKGGGLVSNRQQTRTTYQISLAILVASGPVAALPTIWADGKIVFDGRSWAGGVAGRAQIYLGTQSQLPDPTLEAALGVGNVPAYRGLAYIVLEDLQLGLFGNRVPNFTFAVQASGEGVPTIGGQLTIDREASTTALTSSTAMAPVPDPVVRHGYVIFNVANLGASASLRAQHVLLSDNQPILNFEQSSTSFTSSSTLYELVWATSPDERYVAILLQQDGALLNSGWLWIYDRVLRQFGAPIAHNLVAAPRTLHWLDNEQLVTIDTQGTTRGVFWWSRAGTGWRSRGFVGVWGVGSSATRFYFGYAHFARVPGGSLLLTANAALDPTSFFVCPLTVNQSGLQVGSNSLLTNSVPSSAGNRADLLPLGAPAQDGEWVLWLPNATQLRLASLVGTSAGASLNRAWTTLTPGGSNSCLTGAVLGTNRLAAVQRVGSQSFFQYGEISLTASSFVWAQTMQAVAGTYSVRGIFQLLALDSQRLALLGGALTSPTLREWSILHRYGLQPARLSQIVADILQRAGLAPSAFELSALPTAAIAGYVLPEPVSARRALGPLQLHTPFHLIESGTQLVARPQAYAASVTVPMADLALNAANNSSLWQQTNESADLPQRVIVDYQDPARDYGISSQQAVRGSGQPVLQLSLPLATTAQLARQIAARELLVRHAERTMVELRLPLRWLTLEAGDVLQLENMVLRCDQIRQREHYLHLKATQVLAAPSALVNAADAGSTPTLALPPPVPTQALLLDCVALRASDDQPGFYVALSGGAGWRAGSLWRADAGGEFAPLLDSTVSAVVGYTLNDLNASQPFVPDRAQTLQVQLVQGTLSGATADQLLQGANTLLINDELMQFEQAQLLGPGHYELRGLWRGRRGTISANALLGSRVVLLQTTTLQFLPIDASQLGQSTIYQALSAGQVLGMGALQTITPQGQTMRPLAPAQLRGQRAAGVGSDLTISWRRRSRIDQSWRDGVDAPLEETSELYRLQIMNGSNVIREFSPTTPLQIYTGAQQIADWGTAPASFVVRVAQYSERVGFGQMASATI